jgi:hypothetical protein
LWSSATWWGAYRSPAFSRTTSCCRPRHMAGSACVA